MYTHWISPLKEQLDGMQRELRSILTVSGVRSNIPDTPSPAAVAPSQAAVAPSQAAVDGDMGDDDESRHGTGDFFTQYV